MHSIDGSLENFEEQPEAQRPKVASAAVEIAFTSPNSDTGVDLREDEDQTDAVEVLVLPAEAPAQDEHPTEKVAAPTPLACATRHVVAPVDSRSVAVSASTQPEIQAVVPPAAVNVELGIPSKEASLPEPEADKTQAPHSTEKATIADKPSPQPETSAPQVSENGNGAKEPQKIPPELRNKDEDSSEKPGSSDEATEANAEKVTPEKTLDERKKEVPEKSNLLFLEVTHAPSAAQEVADTLKEAQCDVVAIENFGYDTPLEQQEASRAHTTLLSSEWSNEIKRDPHGEVAQKTIKIFSDGNENVFKLLLLAQLMGTDMEVALLDMAKDHPGAPLLGEAQLATKKFEERMRAYAPNSELRELLRQEVHAWSVADVERDDCMTAQLKELQQKYPNAKIGIITGSVHTSISHAFAAAEEGQVERKFITPEHPFKKDRVEKERYPYWSQLHRELQFFPEKEHDDRLLDRVLLEYIFVEYTGAFTPRSERLKNALNFIDNLSDDEVGHVLNKIDKIKKRSPKLFGSAHTVFSIERLLTKLSKNKN